MTHANLWRDLDRARLVSPLSRRDAKIRYSPLEYNRADRRQMSVYGAAVLNLRVSRRVPRTIGAVVRKA